MSNASPFTFTAVEPNPETLVLERHVITTLDGTEFRHEIAGVQRAVVQAEHAPDYFGAFSFKPRLEEALAAEQEPPAA